MTGAVAVLNASYEQIGNTRLHRAIALVLKGDAVIEEGDPHISIRSQELEFPLPLIIRLLRFVKVPFKFGPKVWTKAGVLERDGHKCAYCRKQGKNIVTTVDHINPVSKGGRDEWLNTVACCKGCNSRKSCGTLEQAGMELLYSPTVPMRVYISSKKLPTRRT
jgi:hypothetical protein